MSFIFTRMSSITYRIVGHDKDLLHQVKKLNDTIFGGSSHEMRSLKYDLIVPESGQLTQLGSKF